MNKQSSPLPNGQTVIDLPNGLGPEMGDGVQLTDNNGAPLQDKKNDLKEIIGNILFAASERDQEKIKNFATETINVKIPQEFAGKDDLVKMVEALGRRASEDPDKVSTNPATGEKEQSLEELASSIANIAGWDIEELINEAKNKEKDVKTTIPPIRVSAKRTPVETTRDEEFKEEEKENPAKKRKKGNPFKVLMGLVGKMLDHGMERREIVKKVMKQEGNKWQQETIEKCIKVVMDIRKKEQRKKAMNTFNLYKYAQKKNVSKDRDQNIKDFEKRKSIYDIPRDIKLMSTMELISRLSYLEGANNSGLSMINENLAGMKKYPEHSLFVKDLKMVKEELSRRNYDKEQLDILTKIVQGIQPEE